ncbi:MAG: P-loop NTPase [Clostridia bacterium]|nr:P-loop NTPase [Clostridia bacterium]
MAEEKKSNTAVEECTHDCSSCGASCSSRQASVDPAAELRKQLNKIGKCFAVMSGKGGVGKSLVTCGLASAVNALGKTVAVIDADITGPSVPKAFGLKTQARANELGIRPVETPMGIKVMSLNLLVENETDPVVWRGSLISNCAQQFYADVVWEEVDYMFVDMPPGTGDIPLTVLQQFKVDGIILVASPQDLVGMIVEKAAKMAKMMKIPIIAYVQNMSYFICPNCSEKHYIFGEKDYKEITAKYGIPFTFELPIDKKYAAIMDKGNAEGLFEDFMPLAKDIVQLSE